MALVLISSRNLVFGPLLADSLKHRGHRAQWYGESATLLAMARIHRPDLVVLDFRDAPREAWDLNGELSRQDPTMSIVFLSSAGGESLAQASARIAADVETATSASGSPSPRTPHVPTPVAPNHLIDTGVCDGLPD